mgnify:CR=1 FL=1
MREVEVLVIGGGPAGMSAAAEAASLGCQVLLVEDKQRLGGQLIKQTHMFFGSRKEHAGTRGFEIAELLEKEVRERGVEVLCGTTATGIFDGNIVGLTDSEKYFCVRAKRIVVATGAYENALAFEGADLPGVFGAGGVQTLMNVEGVLPGRRFVMVGAGNIGLIVSYQLLQAGAEVVCIVEAAERVGGYEVHAAKVRRHGVPILLSHTVVKALGEERVEGAVLAEAKNFKPVAGTEFEVACDAICVAVGLSPLIDLLAQAGCKVVYSGALGGYVAWHNEDMRTSIKEIYVAGDASGIEEASTAMLEGRIAGCAVARSLGKGRSDTEKRLEGLKRRLAELRGGPFGAKARTGKGELWGVELVGSRLSKPDRQPAFSAGRKNGFVAVIECPQHIPCNPCVEACPQDAIRIEEDINGLPVLDEERCTGCGRCMLECPGLAIFLVRDNGDGTGTVAVPWEMLPIPQKGEKVVATNRSGLPVCEAEVERVVRKNGRAAVYLRVSREQLDEVRCFAVGKRVGALFVRRPYKGKFADDVLICRCEDVWRSQIEELLKAGYTSFEEIKRILRCGMGPCQGKTCQRLVLGLIAAHRGCKLSDLSPQRSRSPVRPTPLSLFANYQDEEED